MPSLPLVAELHRFSMIVFLVELRLLLVAEVEEGEEEDRQEEGWEVESGVGQREERTLTWMAMVME